MAKSQLRIGVVLSYINMAIGTLIPMFYTPIMLDLLGQSEYGLFKLANSATSYLSLISFGIGSAVVRYLTKYRAEKDKDGEEGILALFNTVFMVISGITIMVGIAISFFVDFIYENAINNDNQMYELRILVLVLSCNTALSFLCTPNNSVVTSHERFIFPQIINILSSILTPILNIILLYLGYKSIGIVTSTFAISILVQISYLVYVRKIIAIKPNYKNMPKFLLKEIFVFSFWVFVANIVNQLYNSTDTLIIGAIPALATIGVAIYNIGVTFQSMMFSFSTGLLGVLTPKVNGMVFSGSDNTQLTDLMIRVGRLQCYIVAIVCSGFIAFGTNFIKLWAGAGYEDAYWVAIATMIPSCIPLIQNVAMNVIVAQNKHRFRSLVLLFIAAINVVGTLILVQSMGIVGAAIVTGGAMILGQGFIMNWYYWKKIGLEIPRFWKEIAKMFVVPTIMCIITLLIKQFITLDTWMWLLLAIIIYTIVFVIVNWLFVMNDYEKDIIRGPIRKIMNKFKKQGAK